MTGSRRVAWSLLLLVPFCVRPTRALAAVADTVRRDWYFRESLAAIRDWEDLLAAWEESVPEEGRTPVLPVPATGEAVEWPDPIPLALLPAEDAGLRVRARWVEGKAEVERLAPGGSPAGATVAPGEAVLGYQHPGGGGKDQWYHRYDRRFDRLGTFRPQPAPFALELASPRDWRRGPNDLRFSLRSVAAEPLTVAARLSFRTPEGERACGEQSVALAPGTSSTVSFRVDLQREGGGLLLLQLEAAGGRFWLPLLTHVETVSAVLGSLDEILADSPEPTAAAQIAELRRQAQEWRGDGLAWRTLFEQASALRDDLLLRRLSCDTLLFVKRKPFDSEQPFMDAHHLHNRPGGGLYRLSPVRPGGVVTPVVDSLGEGIYRNLCLHWGATKLLFAFGNGSDRWDGQQSYHLYEVNVDGTGLRRLTDGPKNDCEPFYLPNGQIGFTSDRSEHFVMCGGDRHAPSLYVMNADGSEVHELSFNMFNDFTPTVLPDGRILYSRWEYNERSVTSLHHPFTVFPDGTMMAPYYGNATIRPNVVMFPRPVPDSHKVMALFTAHHGQTHGAIGLIDERRGMDGGEPLTLLTPNVPVTGEKAEDSRWGWFSDPMPLSETTYLCAYTPTVRPWLERTWALYVGDRHGNLALVYRDPDISCAEPVPLALRPRPHPLPPAPTNTDAEDGTATLLLLDVNVNLGDVPRGAAKYLRVLEDVPRRSVPFGGVITTSGTSIYTIKRIFGTVPLEADGSACFTVPANRNVYFEVLDADRREIQRMRSVVCLKPKETQTCVGCHEPRTTAPPNRTPLALRRPPSVPTPPPWGDRTLSFLRDVQPLLNRECVRCHAFDRPTNRVILTDDLTDQFTIGYQELLPYLAVANAMRWDNPEDVYARPPYTYGSRVSPLMKLLSAGHHEVQLSATDWERLGSWVDANGVYYDRYEANHWENRRLFPDSRRPPLADLYRKRCAACHGEDSGGEGNWWLSLNRRDVRLSRALQAPLARAAGGWQRCDEVVFASTEDPDYRALLGALTALRRELDQYPREDLLSLRGTEAETQAVELPSPPPSRPRAPEPPPGDWVYLSDLKWESGKAGWTPNGDGLPRLNRDIEDHPLRLGGRAYRKGLGAHAPSEIVYRLDGGYARFFALIGGAESGGTVVFQVFADDRCLYDSGVMHGLREVKEVDLPMAGVRTLRLVVTDAGDGIGADEANWANARLLRAPGHAQ